MNKRINSVRKKLEDVVTDIIETGGIPTPDLVKINFEKNEETQLTKQPKPKRFWNSYEQFLKDKSKHHRGYTKTLISLKNTLKSFETKTNQTLSFDFIQFGRFETEFKSYCLDVEIPPSKNSKQKKISL